MSIEPGIEAMPGRRALRISTRLLMTRELTCVLAHEITHIAKHDVELMQLAGIVGQMTRVIAQVAIIIAIATWLLDIFGAGEGVDGLSLGVLVAAPIAGNLILGIPRTGSAGFANRRPRRGRRVRTSASPYRTISRTSGSGGCRLPPELGAGCHRLDGSIGGMTTFGGQDDALVPALS
jgi:hypothetical protein